jgi:hypothetical protein
MYHAAEGLMDAAADYAAAKAMLTRPLPAYVTYAVHAHVKADAIVKDTTEEIVVRTKDGKILKGHPGAVPGGAAANTGNEPVTDPAFKPRCYEAAGARLQRFEDRELEAIALRDLCKSDADKGSKEFETLYVDPRTHEPVAATVVAPDPHVDVRVEQRFARIGDRAMPSTLYVRVKGSGFMFWLDVEVNEQYSNYRFSNTEP